MPSHAATFTVSGGGDPVVVNPGQVVVLKLDDDATQEMARGVQAQLEQWQGRLGVRFVLLGKGVSVARVEGDGHSMDTEGQGLA